MTHPPIDPQLAARQELATPLRYHLQGAPPATQSWWDRLMEALGRLLERLFSIHAGASVGNFIVILALLAVAAVTIFLVTRFFSTVPRRRGAETEIEELSAERAEHIFARKAFVAAERGDFVTAVRLLLRAAVVMLDLRGALRDDASATVGELRRQTLGFGESVAVPFGSIASAYVTGVYARLPVEETTWRKVRDAYEALREAQR